jgi:Holliday junction resolvase
MAMHKPSDPATAGATGSHASNIAEGMLALCGTTVMYGNQKSVVQDLAERVGLNDREVYELTTWARQGRGRALWRVGTRTYKVQQVLTTRERELFETDMAEAPEPALISS